MEQGHPIAVLVHTDDETVLPGNGLSVAEGTDGVEFAGHHQFSGGVGQAPEPVQLHLDGSIADGGGILVGGTVELKGVAGILIELRQLGAAGLFDAAAQRGEGLRLLAHFQIVLRGLGVDLRRGVLSRHLLFQQVGVLSGIAALVHHIQIGVLEGLFRLQRVLVVIAGGLLQQRNGPDVDLILGIGRGLLDQLRLSLGITLGSQSRQPGHRQQQCAADPQQQPFHTFHLGFPPIG